MYRFHALFSPVVHTLNTFVQNGVEKPIFVGPLLKMSSSCFQLNAPFLQNTGLYTRIFENAAIFIRVVVVLRPRAIARALTACACAAIIQPCSYQRFSTLGARFSRFSRHSSFRRWENVEVSTEVDRPFDHFSLFELCFGWAKSSLPSLRVLAISR